MFTRSPRWSRTRFAGIAGSALLTLTSCGEPGVTSDTVRKPISVSELPAPILKAAQKAVPGVKYDEAWKNLDRGATLQSYEVRGRTANGKICEVRVSTDGRILESD